MDCFCCPGILRQVVRECLHFCITMSSCGNFLDVYENKTAFKVYSIKIFVSSRPKKHKEFTWARTLVQSNGQRLSRNTKVSFWGRLRSCHGSRFSVVNFSANSSYFTPLMLLFAVVKSNTTIEVLHITRIPDQEVVLRKVLLATRPPHMLSKPHLSGTSGISPHF